MASAAVAAAVAGAAEEVVSTGGHGRAWCRPADGTWVRSLTKSSVKKSHMLCMPDEIFADLKGSRPDGTAHVISVTCETPHCPTSGQAFNFDWRRYPEADFLQGPVFKDWLLANDCLGDDEIQLRRTGQGQVLVKHMPASEAQRQRWRDEQAQPLQQDPSSAEQWQAHVELPALPRHKPKALMAFAAACLERLITAAREHRVKPNASEEQLQTFLVRTLASAVVVHDERPPQLQDSAGYQQPLDWLRALLQWGALAGADLTGCILPGGATGPTYGFVPGGSGRPPRVDLAVLHAAGVFPHTWPIPLSLKGVRQANRHAQRAAASDPGGMLLAARLHRTAAPGATSAKGADAGRSGGPSGTQGSAGRGGAAGAAAGAQAAAAGDGADPAAEQLAAAQHGGEAARQQAAVQQHGGEAAEPAAEPEDVQGGRAHKRQRVQPEGLRQEQAGVQPQQPPTPELQPPPLSQQQQQPEPQAQPPAERCAGRMNVQHTAGGSASNGSGGAAGVGAQPALRGRWTTEAAGAPAGPETADVPSGSGMAEQPAGSAQAAGGGAAAAGDDVAAWLAQRTAEAPHKHMASVLAALAVKDDTDPVAVWKPLQLLGMAKQGGEAIKMVLKSWDGYTLAKKQQFYYAAVSASEEGWQALENNLRAHL